MKEKKNNLLFKKENYKYMIIGVVFIMMGFIIMSGGGSDDPSIFKDKIYNFRRIRLAPALILIGFAIQVYAILKSSK